MSNWVAGRQQPKVALLRGINVGRAKRVAMADLRALVEGLGYTNVRTLLNSGNVVFTVPGSAKGDPASRIEAALEKQIGVSSRVIVLSAAELDRIVKDNPLLEVANDPSRLLVAVPRTTSGLKRLAALRTPPTATDAFEVGRRAAYLWCSDGILASRPAEAILKDPKAETTTRNWGTILKLHALMQEPG